MEEKDLRAYKAHLNEEQIKKQQVKKTWDSPCLSLCSYNEESQCIECGILKSEKTCWKEGSLSSEQRLAIWNKCLQKQKEAAKSSF